MLKPGLREAISFSVLACGILLLASGSAAAATYSINYRGKTSFSESATTIDQNGASMPVNEMSGVTYRGGNNFTAVSDENGKLINYLLSPTPQLEMSRYYGRHIIVSGQEGLDERWKNTPVLTIQKIYVVKD